MYIYINIYISCYNVLSLLNVVLSFCGNALPYTAQGPKLESEANGGDRETERQTDNDCQPPYPEGTQRWLTDILQSDRVRGSKALSR